MRISQKCGWDKSEMWVVVCGDVKEKSRNQFDEIFRKSEQKFVHFEKI